MKKFLLTFLTLTLALVLCLSSTACTGATILSLSDKWNNNNADYTDHANITETLEYSVNYTTNYNELIKRDYTLTDDNFSLEYSNGKYIQVLKASSSLPKDIENKFEPEQYKESLFYHLHTELSIDVEVYDNVGEKQVKTHTDTVVTDTYFFSAGLSFAPIWSHTKVDNMYIRVDSGDEVLVNTDELTYDFTITYGANQYTLVTLSENEGEPPFTTKTYDYSYKSAIDNSQLLFAIRNISIEEKNSFKLPTISPSYGEAKTLAVYYDENANSTFSNKLSFVSPKHTVIDKDVEIPVKNLKFVIDSTRDTGAYHYVNIQKSATDDVPFRSLMTEYAAPLLSYNAMPFLCLGAMVYKLNSVTIEQA